MDVRTYVRTGFIRSTLKSRPKNCGAKTNKPGSEPNFKIKNSGNGERGFKPLKGCKKGARGKESHTIIPTKSDVMNKSSINRFRPGLCPGPHGETYNTPPDPIVGWEGETPPLLPPPSKPSASCFSAPLISALSLVHITVQLFTYYLSASSGNKFVRGQSAVTWHMQWLAVGTGCRGCKCAKHFSSSSSSVIFWPGK